MNPRSFARMSFLVIPACILFALWLSPTDVTHSVAPAIADPNYPWNSDPDGFPGYRPTGGPGEEEDKEPGDPIPLNIPPGPLSLTQWTAYGPAPIVNGSIPGGRSYRAAADR